MCGLVGIISKNKNGFIARDIDMFTEMLYADQLRGSHGTGIFYNKGLATKNIHTLKAPIKSSEFIAHQKYAQTERDIISSSNFVVGHNRAATRGKLNAECTHPFREKHITLVHNGTLVSQKELHPTAEVDSHAICHSIANIGYSETLKKVDGAFALIWFNVKEGTLNLCRNNQRPLNIIETPHFYLICSELELGLWIAKRNNVIVTKSFEIEPRKLYQFNVEDMGKFETKDVEYKSFTTTKSWNNFSNKDNCSDYFDCGDEYKEETNSTYTKPTIFSVGDKVKFTPSHLVFDPNVTYLSGDILKNITIPQSCRIKVDYENLHRVKVFGAVEELRKLMKQKHLEGFIASTTWSSGGAKYAIRDVVQELNILTLPTKKTDVNTADLCDFCTTEFGKDDVHHHVDNYVLCSACVADLNKATASVH